MEMQKVGDICETCRSFWETKGKEPKKLRRLPGVTMNKSLIVPVCTFCDGDTLKTARAGNHTWPMDDDDLAEA